MAAGQSRVRVQVQGMRELQRRLRAEPMLGGPLKTAFESLGQLGVTEVQRVAPMDTGKLRASAVHKVGGGPVAKNVRIRVPVKSVRGYRYAGWLQYAPNSPRKGWLDAVREKLFRLAPGVLNRAAREIERAWRR